MAKKALKAYTKEDLKDEIILLSNEVSVDEKSGAWKNLLAYSFVSDGVRSFGLSVEGYKMIIDKMIRRYPREFDFEEISFEVNEGVEPYGAIRGLTCMIRIKNKVTGIIETGLAFEKYYGKSFEHHAWQRVVSRAKRNAYIRHIPYEFQEFLIKLVFAKQLRLAEGKSSKTEPPIIFSEDHGVDSGEKADKVVEESIKERHQKIDNIMKTKNIPDRLQKLQEYARIFVETNRHCKDEQWFKDILFRLNTSIDTLNGEQVSAFVGDDV